MAYHSRSMDIHGKSGAKVKYLDENGYEGDRVYAREYMSKGAVLTVKYIDVGNWASLVSFEEIPGKEFNTVMFEDVDGTI